ncbi:MAG: ABC transporter ATP-binding protein [Pseudomonadota bacterium]|nr:ABC transporter ATP-binding protein [Pseudomonadota bacterium]
MTPLLEIRDLSKHFGGLRALHKVNLVLKPGRLHAIIGPNGAGKTTLFNVITGTLPATSGQVLFRGENITDLSPHRVSRIGLARTLQIKSVFDSLTVEDNIWIAAESRRGVFRPFARARSDCDTARRVEAVLEETGLTDIRREVAGTLSYGDVALLEIGIALATEPSLLLLDEPICGMGPAETKATIARIKQLAKRIDVIIIEHDMPAVFNLADEITVMVQGQVLAQGKPEAIAANKAVREAYLGDDELAGELSHA